MKHRHWFLYENISCNLKIERLWYTTINGVKTLNSNDSLFTNVWMMNQNLKGKLILFCAFFSSLILLNNKYQSYFSDNFTFS